MTRQRRAILDALRRLESHPTGDEVYRAARQRLPHISLGTVYRNLELLSARGLIRKLDVAGAQRRFDGSVDEHYHVRCLGCNRVEDLPVKPATSIARAVRQATNYEIVGHQTAWVGFCPECVRQRSKSHAYSPETGRREA